MPKIRISLANKCQILFGTAVILILVVSLAVPFYRMETLTDEAQQEVARRFADAWIQDLVRRKPRFIGESREKSTWSSILSPNSGLPFDIQTPTDLQPFNIPLSNDEQQPLGQRLVNVDHINEEDPEDQIFFEALEVFGDNDQTKDMFRVIRSKDDKRIYRYVRAIREMELVSGRDYSTNIVGLDIINPARYLLLIDLRADWAESQIKTNRIYLALSGLSAGVLAIIAFWFISTRIILSPVRVLRETAEKVADGDVNIRADISTGDEFEQLSDTFNQMLEALKTNEDELRDLNKQLDLKLDELARSNLSLYEANRIKGDFLANVSHELRTPLNSIIGFAEVLNEAENTPLDKKRRYIDNILTSSRSLLQLITELLDLAKIEAGRIELHLDTMPVAETCQTLFSLIRPQADRKRLDLRLDLEKNIPTIQTDPGKIQQIIFNFLSNAVKFTPEEGSVELGASTIQDSQSHSPIGVRIWVTDTGPGIAEDQQELIFDKFRQLDAAHTREHSGTGLGLAISRELAKLLEARIELDSYPGKGSTFSLVIPLEIVDKSAPLMPEVNRSTTPPSTTAL